MSDPWVGIIPAACDLKRAAPGVYDDLIRALKVYTGQLVTQLITAEKDRLELAQGRAQVLAEFTERLENCFALEAKYRKRP